MPDYKPNAHARYRRALRALYHRSKPRHPQNPQHWQDLLKARENARLIIEATAQGAEISLASVRLAFMSLKHALSLVCSR